MKNGLRPIGGAIIYDQNFRLGRGGLHALHNFGGGVSFVVTGDNHRESHFQYPKIQG
jgi:hypothetical protein